MKTCLKIIIFSALAAIVAAVYVNWRTSVSFTPNPSYDLGSSFSFQADDFLMEIPDSYKMLFLTGLVRWPDGFRLRFREYLDTEREGDSAWARYVEKADSARLEDLTIELGRPSLMGYLSSESGSGGPELSAMIKFHNGLVIFSIPGFHSPSAGGRAPAEAEIVAEQEAKRLLLLSVKEFLEAYFWIGYHPDQTEPGVFRTRLGLISKNESTSFRYLPLAAKFWSSAFGQSFELAAVERQGENDGFCSLGRLERFRDQWQGRASYRSNCLGLEVGGLRGDELLNLDGSDLTGDVYRLTWEQTADRGFLDDDGLRIVFQMVSPLKSWEKDKSPETPETVTGRWRAMLRSVRFF